MVKDLLKIKWRFDKLYLISNNGCWNWVQSLNNKGYGRISLGKKNYRMLAHRYSWIIHNKMKIPDELCVLHQCDNAKCVNPNHLKLGSKAQNNREMAERNRSEKGSKRYNSKLTEKSVLWANKMYSQKILSQHKIAEKLAVSVMTINKAINGKKWKHVNLLN